MCWVCESEQLEAEWAEAWQRRRAVRELGSCPECGLAAEAQSEAGAWCRSCRRYSAPNVAG